MASTSTLNPIHFLAFPALNTPASEGNFHGTSDERIIHVIDLRDSTTGFTVDKTLARARHVSGKIAGVHTDFISPDLQVISGGLVQRFTAQNNSLPVNITRTAWRKELDYPVEALATGEIDGRNVVSQLSHYPIEIKGRKEIANGREYHISIHESGQDSIDHKETFFWTIGLRQLNRYEYSSERHEQYYIGENRNDSNTNKPLLYETLMWSPHGLEQAPWLRAVHLIQQGNERLIEHWFTTSKAPDDCKRRFSFEPLARMEEWPVYLFGSVDLPDNIATKVK